MSINFLLPVSNCFKITGNRSYSNYFTILVTKGILPMVVEIINSPSSGAFQLFDNTIVQYLQIKCTLNSNNLNSYHWFQIFHSLFEKVVMHQLFNSYFFKHILIHNVILVMRQTGTHYRKRILTKVKYL